MEQHVLSNYRLESLMKLADAVVGVVEDTQEVLFTLNFLLRSRVKQLVMRAGWVGMRDYMLTHGVPDLLLMDLNLAFINGFDAFKQFSEHFSLSTKPKVVAITASVLPETIERARTVGFDGFIAKPFNDQVLLDVLQQILDGAQLWVHGVDGREL